tara:strand:- start:41681 stop:43957 length:2277 start_codon:yes stop_codon:yes gene_type:complete
MDNPGLKQLTAAVRARLYYSETNGGDIAAVNKDTKAIGKYQFHPKYWWEPIKKFAKKAGYGDINEEDFKKSAELQDEFFEKEYMPKMYSFVKNNASKNKRNLDLDEIGQLYHMSPKAALTYIQGGKFEPGGNNMGVERYLEKGKKGLLEFEAQPVQESTLIPKEEQTKNVNEYISRMEKIQNNDEYTDGGKKLRMKELKQEFYNKGYSDIINAELGKKINNFETEKALFQEFYKEIKGNIKAKASGGRPYHHLSIETEKGRKLVDEISKNNPEFAKAFHKTNNGKYTTSLGLTKSGNGVSKYIMDNAQKFSGKEFGSLKELIDDKKYGISIPTGFGPFNKIDLFDNKNDEFIDLDFSVDNSNIADFSIANTDVVPKEKNLKNEQPKKTEVATTTTVAKDGNAVPIEVSSVEDANAEKRAQLMSYLDREYLEEPQDMVYDKKDFEPSIPFEAIGNAMVGIAGMERANADVPMRTEQISQGVLDYAAKLQKVAQMGLPPEIEAKLKDDAASAYSSMMNNIVEASGGNRNLVLGNQGQLDYNRLKANNDIAIADFQEKQAALDKYGEVMSYINDFDSRRDIDNTKTKQAMDLQTRQDGTDLAFAGFGAMSDALADAAQNAPGTASHMLMSQIRQKAFGYDPDMKDDGKGTKKGTRSWYMNNVINPIKQNNTKVDYLKETVPTLSQEGNKFLNLAASKTGDIDSLVKAVDFAKNTDFSNVSQPLMESAIETGDYKSMLYKDIDDKQFLSQKETVNYDNINIS